MAVTRIKNNQITDATINAASKLVDYSVTAGKLANSLTYGSDLTITGNLTVNGATTTVSTTTTTVEDAIMVLNSDATGAFANDTGLYLERGDNTSVFMGYDGSATQFALVETSSVGTDATMTVTDYADLRLGGLTADDAVTATGNVTGGNLNTAGLVAATGNVTGGNINTAGLVAATGNVTGGNLVTAGVVAATGNVSGGNLVTAGVVAATGNVTGGNLVTAGVVAATGNVTGGNLVTAGVADVTGTITGGNLTTTGLTSTGDLTVLASGTIEFNQNVLGNVADPTLAQDAATKNYVDNALSSVFTVTDGSNNQTIADGDTLTFAGTANEIEVAVSATDTVTIGLPNDVTIGNDLTVTGDLTVNGTTTTVNSTVSTLVDPIFQLGRGADDAALSTDDNKDRGITMYYYDGSEKFAFMGWDNSASTMSFYSDASNTGEVISGTKAALDAASLAVSATVTATGNITGGNINTAGLVSATGNVTGGNINTAGVVAATGNVSGGNLVTAGKVDTATLETSGEATLASATVSDLTSGRVVLAGTAGALEDSTNLTFDGSTLVVTGAATVSTTLGVTGNVTGGNLITAGLVSATGNVTGGNLVTAGVVAATGNVTGGNINTAGILSTASILESATDVVINEAGADVNFRVESDNNANMLFVDAGTDSVNIGTGTPTTDVSFKVGTTDSIIIPTGNTAQRPASPVVGMLRFSTTNDSLEQYSSVDGWETVGAPSFTVIASETFDGDNSTVAFSLSEAQTTASCIVSINGVVQLPTTAYSVSGTTMTFTEAPLSGDKIEVRKITTTTTLTNLTSTSGGAVVSVPNETEVDIKGNLMPAADSTYSIGNSTVRWTDIYVDAGTIHLGALQLKESGGALAVFGSDGTTPADITSASTSSITNGTSNVAVANDSSVTVTVAGSTAATFAAEGLTVAGNLTVNGTTTTINSTTLTVDDKTIVVASGAADSTAADGAGLSVDGASASITYSHSGTKWVLNKATDVQSLLIGGTAVTSTAAELNLVDGSSAGTVVNSKAVVYGASGEVNATTLQVGGVSITATPAELNLLDGVTSTTAELNILDGVTSTAAELNLVDGSAAGTIVNNKAVIYNSSGDVIASGISTPDITKTGTNGVGDIGQTGNRFGTVYGLATSAQYADLAEKYEADADYEPGTVLHFGGEKEVSQCDVDHCTKVAGVVSTAPAYRMNDGLEAEHTAMVALQGRVPCKVQGPVAKGDMMVSAGNGKARAEADPKVGAVIGKALEDFNGEEGVIEVVIGKH